MKKVLICAALTLVSSFASGQEDVTEYDLWKLCSNEDIVELVIEELTEEALDSGITGQRIQNLAESRLRAARIFNDGRFPSRNYLYINLNAGSLSEGNTRLYYSISTRFTQRLRNESLGIEGFAVTWNLSGLGIGDDTSIMQRISEHVDEFVLEFLKVRTSGKCVEQLGAVRVRKMEEALARTEEYAD